MQYGQQSNYDCSDEDMRDGADDASNSEINLSNADIRIGQHQANNGQEVALAGGLSNPTSNSHAGGNPSQGRRRRDQNQ